MTESKPTPSGLCGRLFDRSTLTRHHCLPEAKDGTSDDVALIGSQCHGMVHATYTNATLTAVYPTIEELRRAPELTAFIQWARKLPATRQNRNKERRHRL